jgi:PPP family 3-phenylpropionic acid transporter
LHFAIFGEIIAEGLLRVVGGIGGGFMIEAYGANTTFMLSALLPLLGFIVIYYGLKNFPVTAS